METFENLRANSPLLKANILWWGFLTNKALWSNRWMAFGVQFVFTIRVNSAEDLSVMFLIV